MLDVKFQPSGPILYPSNIYRTGNKSISNQISLPIIVSTTNPINLTDKNNVKRWIGHCSYGPSNQFEIPATLYNMHRKFLHRELQRCDPRATLRPITQMKIRHQQQKNNNNIEPLKATPGIGATVSPIQVGSNIEEQSSHLFETFSRQTTNNTNATRASNNFANNTCNSLSSWQKYWKSSYTQRRRKLANDSEHSLHHSKRELPLLATSQFISLRDSESASSSAYHSNHKTPSIPPTSCTPTKLSSSLIYDKQSPSMKEENCFCLPQLVSSYTINSQCERTSQMNHLKSFEETLLSPIHNNEATINNDHAIENTINTVVTRLFRLPLPSAKPILYRSPLKRGTRPTSIEKPSISLSTLKETKVTIKSQTKKSTSKQSKQMFQKPSKTIKSKSKYESSQWELPYIGIRFDPPTPPSSPSLFPWPQDKNRTLFESNSIKYQ